jgi:glycosyltransferase involved in cell wall biosynthesis
MRIAVNTRFLLPTGLEGLGHYTHEVMKAMVRAHPEDEFLFYFDRPYDDQFLLAGNVEAKVIRPPARHPFLWYWWFERALPSRLRKDRPDVFFSPDGFASLSYSGKQAMVIHDLGFEHYPGHVPFLVRRYYQHFTPRYARHVDRIFAVSQSTKQDVVNRYGIDAGRIDIAYNGVRGHFRPLSEEEALEVRKEYSQGLPYFLFVGAMHPRKNIGRLLQAFDLFATQNDEVRLLLTGRKAWMSSDIEEIFMKMEYSDRVSFLGYLNEEDLARVTGAAHALVYPSLFEGFGVPLLEAMTCGVPIVTSEVSCMPEIVDEAAILVDPTDIGDISAGMIRVVRDTALRQELSRKGPLRASDFSWEQTSRIVYNGLRSI